MDLTIEQTCPSCGAPIDLHEADRLIKCPFCDIGNYMVAKGVSRFVLPDKAPDSIAREDLLYAPYLRFKGIVFSCRGQQVDYKIIDTTHQGLDIPLLPLSLGLRPQAMKIFPVTGALAGRFFKQVEKVSSIFTRAIDMASFCSSDVSEGSLFHRAFIGETISCIYLPLYLQDGTLYDAVLNRPLGEGEQIVVAMQKAMRYSPAWEPGFLATVCPNCAETLSGEHDSLVLACANCESLWGEHEGAFHPVNWRIIRSEHKGEEHLYLPFWKIRPAVTGIELTSFGDFLRLTNQPVVVKKEHDALDFRFWVPAFKIRPNFFLQLAKSMTMSQARFSEGDSSPAGTMYPVTLPSSEAVQSLKTILADITMDKRHFLPNLPSIDFQAQQTELVYLPFTSAGHDLVQETTTLALTASVLQFGRSL